MGGRLIDRIRPPVPVRSKTSAQVDVRPSVPRQGSFSAFIRRLTGKSPQPQVVQAPSPRSRSQPFQNAPQPQPIPLQHARDAPPRATSVSQSLPSTSSRRPVDLSIDTRSTALAPPSAPIVSSAPVSTLQPHEIPLPSSPMMMPSVYDRELEAFEYPLPPSPTSTATSTINDLDIPPLDPLPSTVSRRAAKPNFGLSAFSEEEEDDDQDEDEGAGHSPSSAESDDLIRPLRSVPCANRDSSPVTPSAYSEMLVTPTSVRGSSVSPPRFEGRLAGSSPPRKAPVTTGGERLSRNDSKWRKSVYGLSDVSVVVVPEGQTTSKGEE
jgi:hypothetical protein